MEERQDRDDHVIGLHANQAPRDVGVHVQLDMGQLGPLGTAGRARGVDDDRGVGQHPRGEPGAVRDGEQSLERMRARGVPGVAHGVDLAHPGRSGALGRIAEHALPGDQDLRPAIAEVERHLRRLEQHVQRHGHAAGLEDPEIGDQELRDVGQLQRHRVPRPQAGRLQAGRQPVRQSVQFPVGHLPACIDSHGLAGRRIRGFTQDDREIEIHRFAPPPRTRTRTFFRSRDPIARRPPPAGERSGRLRHPLPVHLSVRAQPATGTGGLPDLPGPSPPGASACPASAAWPSKPPALATWRQYVPQHVMSSTRRPRTSATPTPARPW